MKAVYILLFFSVLFILPGRPSTVLRIPGNHADTLYPPTALHDTEFDCMTLLLRWSKPQTPSGTDPPGILGYYIHGNGHRLAFVTGADKLEYYYGWPHLGNWDFYVTAYYDLAYYGQPGLFAESPVSNKASINIFINCDFPLLMNENWDEGTFAFRCWQANSNWWIETQKGNPSPSAVFKGAPLLTGYQADLISMWNLLEYWPCAKIILSFDLKLENINPTGKEMILLQAVPDSSYETFDTIRNISDMGWIHNVYDLSKYAGDQFMLRFRVKGTNSGDIAGWYLDNIKIDPLCLPPIGGKAVRQKNNINRISWVPPCANSLKSAYPDSIVGGYYIYRSDSSGNPPFYRLNERYVKDTVYYDTLPPGLHSNFFSYYITDWLTIPETNYYACESPPGDTLKVTSLSVASLEESEIQVYPNPSSAGIIITGSLAISSCEIWNTSGQMVELIRSNYTKELKLDVSKLAPGLYFLRIQTGKGVINRKLFRSAR